MTASEALVFDIKRFAVHDGSGIRTTVFLKGCPLRCRWCQNPEGLMAKRGIVYLASRCIHCGCCQKACPSRIAFREGRPYFDPYDDLAPAIEACPAGALKYDSTFWKVEDLVDKIREDEVFFQEGGGVTFSGGEPFLQFSVLRQLLQKCHEAGLHTAIETSLFTETENVREVLPYLDEIYCDMKLYDEKRHIACTGVSNQKIRKNIAFLLQSDKKDAVTVRTPLIPGFTADDENIGAIADYLVSCYADVRYELLNYNPLAPAKYPLTPFVYGVKEDAKQFSTDEMAHFEKVIRTHGIRRIVSR